MTRSLLYLLVILLSCSIIGGCSNKFYYTVSLANYGDYGITFIKFPYEPVPRKITTGLPGVRGDLIVGYSFYGDRTRLPKEPVEIVWQLNKLTDCKLIVGPYKSHDSDYPGMFTSKMNCTWTPLPDKIFRKIIDIRKLSKDNMHAKRAGERDGGFLSLSGKRIMTITLVFVDDRLDVKIGTFISNPWANNLPKDKNSWVAKVQVDLGG